MPTTTAAINQRYSGLAESSCCLSCGGALNYVHPQTGETGVDLGSGRGTDVLRIADRVGMQGKAYGIDISEGMLQKSRQTAKKLGAVHVKFLRAELENLPLPDQHADFVISNCTINHASDKQAVWSEIYRILKPGGRFSVSDIYALKPVPRRYATDHKAVAQCWAGAITRDRYLNILDTVGFIDINIIEESTPYTKGQIEVSSFTITGNRPLS